MRELIANSRNVRFTRVDVAIDLPVSLRSVQALGSTTKKASAVWSTGIETIYLGDKRAARSLAIYDKHKDLLRRGDRASLTAAAVGDLTRFEARLKKLKLEPAAILEIENFRTLQLLWTDTICRSSTAR